MTKSGGNDGRGLKAASVLVSTRVPGPRWERTQAAASPWAERTPPSAGMTAPPTASTTPVIFPFSKVASIPWGPVRVVRSNPGVNRMSSLSRRGRLMPSMRRP